MPATTRETPDPFAPPRRSSPPPALVVAWHDDAALLGRAAILRPGEPLVLGRECAALGGGVFDDDSISRSHALVRLAGGRVEVVDQRSRNGIRVNGARVERSALAAGDVLAIGGVLLVLAPAPPAGAGRGESALVGCSAAMAEVRAQVAMVAPASVVVLIQGETGTGKELVAAELHRLGGRKGRLVAVNCGAVPDALLHGELFGHRRGAFTGADRDRPGLVAAAAGGTLFLDEVGEVSPAMQVALLRLLEQREYRPLGGEEVRATDARVVAATHVDADRAVAEGRLREDLYGRLSRWVVRLPPLRERREDIALLVHELAKRAGASRVRAHPRLAEAILLHPWPGNVRELQAVVEIALLEAQGGDLDLSPRVAERLAARARPPDPLVVARPPSPPSALELRERFAALNGNMRALAAALGVPRPTLYRWFSDAGLDPAALRAGEG